MTDATGNPALLEARGLTKTYGGIRASNNVSLSVQPGEVHAIIGPNGAGKTTLLAQLSGFAKPDAGHIIFAGEDITAMSTAARAKKGLARSFQITSIIADFTALANVALAVQSVAGHSYRFWKPAAGDGRLEGPARALLQNIGLREHADTLAGNLAHGEQRQLEIAMALALKPQVLLLDEPMAGMGSANSQVMTEFLGSLRGHYAVVLVEHDMDAVFALADRITVLVYGAVVASGSPEQIRTDPAVREAYLGANDDA
jgi:branched-chain amino acid transport system ATP-binding protein